LVVIAIIGILSSVVLASLSSARNKGKDAAVKSELASMRAQAEIYFSRQDTYVDLCATDSVDNGFGGTGGLLAAVGSSEGVATNPNLAFGTAGGPALVTCHEAPDSWAVDAPLIADTTATMYCVDSVGSSMATNTPIAMSGTACTK
jgi:type II secretory pathway pseudopilin PulG